MTPEQLEQKLRNTPGLTDELRADLWDLHMDNVDSIKHPVLRAIGVMSKMSPENRDLAEKYPTIFKMLLGDKK